MGQYASPPAGLFWSSAHLMFDVTQDLHVDPTFHFMWTPLRTGSMCVGTSMICWSNSAKLEPLPPFFG